MPYKILPQFASQTDLYNSGQLLYNLIGSSSAGVSSIAITGGNLLTGNLNFSGIGGLNVYQSGNNTIIFSGGGGGNTGGNAIYNSFYVNSGSGLYVFQTLVETGIDKKFVQFPTTLDYNATIVASLRNEVSNTILGLQISGVTTSGYWGLFSDTVTNTGYYINSFACNSTGTGLATTIIVNNYNTIGSDNSGLSGLLYQTGADLYGMIVGFSGVFNTTGSLVQNQINTISGNLNTTGALLNNKINSLSGFFTGSTGQFYLNSNPNRYVNSGDIPYYHLQDYTSLSQALSLIGTGTLASLVISRSGYVTGNVTIPPNYSLVFTNSGCLTIKSGVTLTIRGDIKSPNNKKIFDNIFSGQGSVSFSNNKVIETFYIPWWGPPNDYSSDAQPYIQSALNSIPNNSILESPQTQNYLLASTLSMTLKHGVVFRTSPGNEMGYTNVGLPFSSFKWTGEAGGTMLSMHGAYRCTVEGWTFIAGGTGGADRVIDIDGYAPGQVTTQNLVKDNVLFLAPRTGAKGVSISETATNNVEFMTLIHNNIRAGGYRTGYGVFMGASANAHGHILKDNNYYELYHGIHMNGGNFQMQGLNNFGDNVVDIWMNDQTYPVVIKGANTESSSQFAYINGANSPISIDSSRIQCYGTVGSGIIEFGPTARYVKVSNNDITSAAPGAYIYDCRNAQNLFLVTENNRYPDTYANNSVSGDTFIFKEPYQGNSKLISNERGITTSQIKARGIKAGSKEYPPFIFEYVKSGEGTGITQLIGLMSTPISGAMEWDGSALYMTQHNGPTRKALAYSGDIPSLTNRLTGNGTINKIPKFTSSTGLINSSMIESGGRVGIGFNTTIPKETLDISGNFRMPYYRHFSIYKQIPNASGAFSELGYFILDPTLVPEGGQGGQLIFTASLQNDYAGDGHSAQLYDFVKLYNDINTPNNWVEIRPRLSTGPRLNTVDSPVISLEASGLARNNFYLRLRVKSGAYGGNGRVNIHCYDDYPFIETSNTGIDLYPVLNYRHTPLTVYNGNVGVRLSSPNYPLHVSGDIGVINGGVYVSGRALITGINTGSFISSSQTGQFYPASNPQSYIRSGDVNNISGALDLRITLTGLDARNNAINLSGNLQATGSTLNTKINILSGYINNSAISNIVYTTGNQNISGTKTFINPIYTHSIWRSGGSAIGVDFTNSSLVDDSDLPSLSWGSRVLNDNSELTTLDWNNKLLYGDGSTTLNWESRILSGTWNIQNFTLNGLVSNNVRIFSSSGISFKTTGAHNLLTIPNNKLFIINSMEVITTALVSASAAPYVKFGNSSNFSQYQALIQTTSNSLYSRHIFDNPQDAIGPGTILNATINTASTANGHTGILLYKGYFLDI